MASYLSNGNYYIYQSSNNQREFSKPILTEFSSFSTITKLGNVYSTDYVNFSEDDISKPAQDIFDENKTEWYLSHFYNKPRIVIKLNDLEEIIAQVGFGKSDESEDIRMITCDSQYLSPNDTNDNNCSYTFSLPVTNIKELYWTIGILNNNIVIAISENATFTRIISNIPLTNTLEGSDFLGNLLIIEDLPELSGVIVSSGYIDYSIDVDKKYTLPGVYNVYGDIVSNEYTNDVTYTIPEKYDGLYEITTAFFLKQIKVYENYPYSTIPITITSNSSGLSYLWNVRVNSNIAPNDPYDVGGSSTSGGGGGSYGGGTFGGGGQSTSDNISGSLPTGSTEVQDASTGLFTRYLCTPQFLNVLGEWLWTTDLGLAIAKAAISLFYSDPAESIISLMSFPFALSTMTGFNSVSQEFYWGNFGAGFQGTAVKSSAVQMDWGSLKIDEYWGNFLDYSPHTKVELYLPWSTGFVELDATQVVGRTISIKTNIDLNKGSCVHNVYDDLGSVIGSYSGQCGKQLPITASDFASKLASITTAAVGTAVAATVSAGSGIVNATGGEIIPFKIAGGDQGLTRQPREFNVESAKSTMQRAVKPAIASAAATALRPAHISRNGSFSDGSAGMGVQYPYIIVSRPTQSVPEEYGHHYGYPSNIYQRLQYLSGYTEIGEIHLTGIPCTDSELNELDRILKGGVLF